MPLISALFGSKLPVLNSFPSLSSLTHLSFTMSAPLLPRATTSLRASASSLRRNLATAVDTPPQPRPDVRHDWRRSEIQRIFDAPLMETIFQAVSQRNSYLTLLILCRLLSTANTTTHPESSSAP